MNVVSWLLWGFVATIVLTTIMSASQGLHLTRMNLPYMLGTMFTPSRDRAKLLGFSIHVVNGWLFSLLYVAAFEAWGRATWWLGAAVGLVHVAFVLTAGMRILPGLHPRMASETARTDGDASARAAGLPRAQLRGPDPAERGRGAPGVRRDPRRVLSGRAGLSGRGASRPCATHPTSRSALEAWLELMLTDAELGRPWRTEPRG